MGDFEDKLASVMNNPEMMAKIMEMAQALGGTSPETPPEPEISSGFPEIDLGMLKKLSGFVHQGNIDAQEKTLLQALNPYLSHRRLQKLENAMRAAKMAKFAAAALGNSGLKLSTGR